LTLAVGGVPPIIGRVPAVPPNSLPRWAGWIGGLLAVPLAVELWIFACQIPENGWNAHRLAAAFTLAQGHELYPALDSAFQTGWFYGPGFPAAFYPLTGFDSPTRALVAGGIWGDLWLILPVILLLRAGGCAGRELVAGAVATGFLLLGNTHTAAWLQTVHVDSVAVGWSVLMAAAAWRYQETRRAFWLHLAAVAAVAAAWTKLTDGIFAVALAAWWARLDSPRLAAIWIAWLSVYGALSTAAVALAFGWDRALYYSFLSQAQNPWRPGGLGLAAVSLGVAWLPWALVAGALLGIARLQRRRIALGGFDSLLLTLALVQLPLGILAAAKAGGGLNSYHGAVFAALALALALVRSTAAESASAGLSRPLVGLTWLMVLAVGLAPLGGRWTLRPSMHQEALLALARENRGRIFFPWNALITLMSERRQLPTEDGLSCMEVLGRKVPAAAVRTAIPEGMKIYYDESAPGRDTMRYFPGRSFIEGYRSPAQPGRRRVFGQFAQGTGTGVSD